MYYFEKNNQKLNITQKLIFLVFFFTISNAIIDTMFNIYLKTYYDISKSYIGFIALLLNFSGILIAFTANYFLEKFHEKKVFITSISTILIIQSVLFFSSSLYFVILLMIFIQIFTVLRTNSFNLLYKDNSKKKDLPKNQGFYYSIQNLAWFLAPILTGLVFASFSVNNMFLLSNFFLLLGIFFYLATNGVKESKHITNEKPLIIKNIISFFSNEKYRTAYMVSYGNAIINSFMYTFMGIILLENGINVYSIGIFLGITTIPLILIGFFNGKIIEKLNFKKTFTTGYLIAIIFLILTFLSPNIYLKMMFFILMFAGLSLVEPTRDTYFFSITSARDEEKYYSIFKTNSYLGLIIAKIVFSIFFLFIKDSNYAFLLLALIIGINLYYTRKIKK